jgi:hypothetical protein
MCAILIYKDFLTQVIVQNDSTSISGGASANGFPMASSLLVHRFRILTDTTDFFRVEYGDVVVLGVRPYLIRHNAKEGRFGVDDEVKFWVKRAIDLKSGSPKIIKLVFYEKFTPISAASNSSAFAAPKKRPASWIWSQAIKTSCMAMQ